MARYIDTTKLMNNMVTFVSPKLAQSIIKAVDETPTEDVVPIVRCKDCKHCGYTSNGYDRQYIMCCNKLNLDTEIYGDFYCGYAEKMEESEESGETE